MEQCPQFLQFLAKVASRKQLAYGLIVKMNWQQVCEDKALADLPYKIELDKYENIIMSLFPSWGEGILDVRRVRPGHVLQSSGRIPKSELCLEFPEQI